MLLHLSDHVECVLHHLNASWSVLQLTPLFFAFLQFFKLLSKWRDLSFKCLLVFTWGHLVESWSEDQLAFELDNLLLRLSFKSCYLLLLPLSVNPIYVSKHVVNEVERQFVSVSCSEWMRHIVSCIRDPVVVVEVLFAIRSNVIVEKFLFPALFLGFGLAIVSLATLTACSRVLTTMILSVWWFISFSLHRALDMAYISTRVINKAIKFFEFLCTFEHLHQSPVIFL